MNKYQVMPQVVIYRDMFDKQELQKFYDLMDLYENDTSQFAITHEELSTREIIMEFCLKKKKMYLH